MAKAIQLPSGSWRVRVYDNELKKQVSFTSKLEGKAGKAEAELMAREYQLGRKQRKEHGRTVGECIDEYIDLKENVLSPKTIAEYRRIRKNQLTEFDNIYLSEISSQDIQNFVNRLALTKKPRTVKNAYSLISCTLKVYLQNLRLNVTRPKIQNQIKQLPNVEDVLRAIVGSNVELPCLLAMWCSLRMSEVRGIKKTDIKDGVLTVQRTIVRIDGEDVEKATTKTLGSTRQIRLPKYILSLVDQVPDEREYLVSDNGHKIYNDFTKLLKSNGMEHMSFHDLRHLNASIMVLLGVPDKYAMERGGWSSTSVLKSVYQHTFSDERKAVDERIDKYFNDILDTLLDTTAK